MANQSILNAFERMWGHVTSAVSTHNSSTSTHSDIRDLITGLTNSKADKSSIPTKVSQLNNDAGYITSVDIDSSQNHVHDNMTVLDGITSAKVSAWDSAENNAKEYTDSHIKDRHIHLTKNEKAGIKSFLNVLEGIIDINNVMEILVYLDLPFNEGTTNTMSNGDIMTTYISANIASNISEDTILAGGHLYCIAWDDKLYFRKGFLYDGNNFVLGNLYITGLCDDVSYDTGEDFCFIYDSALNTAYVYTLQTESTHSIGITKVEIMVDSDSIASHNHTIANIDDLQTTLNDLSENIVSESTEWLVVDENENVITRVDEDGLSATVVTANQIIVNSTDVETALNELKTSFQDGCSTIASAITEMGVATANNASPETMAENIKSLPSTAYCFCFEGGIARTSSRELKVSIAEDVYWKNATGNNMYWQKFTIDNIFVQINGNAQPNATTGVNTYSYAYDNSTGIVTITSNLPAWSATASNNKITVIAVDQPYTLIYEDAV